MTEDEIDAYYERKQEQYLQKYYSIQARRAIREDRRHMLWWVCVMTLTVMVCTIFLKVNFQVQQQVVSLARLQKQIEKLQMDNADAAKRIDDSTNLREVQEKATALGMVYPKEGNIIYYTVTADDYMYQSSDIPEY